MSYFNEDQQDHMRALNKAKLEDLSWCGWFIGNCYHTECQGKGSRADFLKVACSECFTLPPNHIIGCKLRLTDTKEPKP